MATTEHEPPVGDRRTLMERFIEAIKRLFHKKTLEEWEEKAWEAEKERQEAEKHRASKEEREERKRRKKEEEAKRAYHERESVQKRVGSEEAYKELQIAEVEEILNRLRDEFPTAKKGYEGAGYLYDFFADTTRRDQLIELIEAAPTAGEVIKDLVRPEMDHNDPGELIVCAQRLLFEASKVGMAGKVQSLLQEVKGRVNLLVEKSFELKKELKAEAERRGEERIPQVPHEKLLEQFPLTSEQKNALLENGESAQTVIEDLFTQPTTVAQQPASWIGELSGDIAAEPSKELVDQVTAIRNEIDYKERSGHKLSPTELEGYYRQLVVAETGALPRDIIADSKMADRVVVANHKYIKDIKNTLAQELAKQLKHEGPPLKTGLTPEQFLETIGRRPGYLGHYLEHSPDIEKLLCGDDEKSMRFRNLVFLTVHSNLLKLKHSRSDATFGLYERADFTSFLNTLSSGMADRKRPKTGEKFGEVWVNWYSQLSETISQCRDIDYWASQPGVDAESFNRSLAVFKNEYFVQAMTIPAVEQSFRAYQTTLHSIRDTNDGYIPPAMVEYNPGVMTSEWDNMTFNLMTKLIAMGRVHDVDRDEYGFHELEENGRTVALSPDPLDWKTLEREDPKGLEMHMYLTLAKGLGLASFEYLNVFANTKVPGSDHPNYSMEGFHSTPYEGIARAGNYFSMMIEKWKFGNIIYFHLMNQLLPTEKKIKMGRREMVDAYIAYRSGKFKEFMMKKYGLDEKAASKLQRIIDLQNVSHCSAAWGPPYTQWRHYDSTLDWSDEQKGYLGGSSRILMARRFAEERVKDYLVVGPRREKFRKKMEAEGKPYWGTDFDILWRKYGKDLYSAEIEEEWDKIQGKTKIGQKIPHHHLRKEAEELTERYIKAYCARVWIETALRNPLAVAHNMEIPVFIEETGETKSMMLHKFIVQKVLGIRPEDTEYGIIPGSDGRDAAALHASPTEEQKQCMRTILDLEGDIVAVKERAMKLNRDLTETDFIEVVGGKKTLEEVDPKLRPRVKQALEYWNIVKQMMLGTTDERKATELYEELGMTLGPDGNYAVEWGKKIKHIDEVLGEIATKTGVGRDKKTGKPYVIYYDREGEKFELPYMLTEEWVGKEWENMFGTDDMAIRQMDILNLGGREILRRGGDWHGHYMGGQKVGEYLTYLGGTGNPDPEELGKILLDIRHAYEEDMIEVGWRVAGILAHATSKLYSWDWKVLGSPAQVDVWGTRRNVAAWMANGRRKFWDIIEHKGVLPPRGENYYYKLDEIYNIHNLRKSGHAENTDVWLQIITLGLLLATLITIYRAFTAKSEEEEGGGGGGGHH